MDCKKQDEKMQDVRQAKAITSFTNMRSRASAEGFMSDEEIEAEISAARENRNGLGKEKSI